MTYLELRRMAEGLDEKAAVRELRSLMTDSRMAGLVWLLEQHHGAYVKAVASQDLAAHHGCLEHAAGSLFALEQVKDVMTAHGLPTPPRRSRQRPASET